MGEEKDDSPVEMEVDAEGDEDKKTDGDEKDEKIDRYHELNSDIKTAVNDFYNQLMRDLDGGKIKIEDGTISHTEDDWSYKLNDLSPMDK